ncbi:BatA domain-containing protein [Candidatus Latescibacterota bacterium]
MNFLNSIVLFGLGAAVLPVVIHLLSRRRAKDIAFPSIELLERMKTDRMRRLRLKQLLVLLLRTLIIILIILAFARPAINSVFKKNARVSAVIILDCSASMMYVHDGEAVFNRALRKAREILNMLGDDDSVALILSTQDPAITGQKMTSEKKELLRTLDTIKNSGSGSNASAAFSLGLDMLMKSAAPNRELYYLTDGASNALPDSLPNVTKPVRLYTVLIGPAERSGCLVQQIDIIDKLLSPGNQVAFRVQVLPGPDDNEINIEFFVNDERKGRNQVKRRSDGHVETEFTYTPDSPGWYSAYATVNDGRFEPGETARKVMYVPEKSSVVMIGDSPENFYFLRKALDPDQEQSMFTIRQVLSSELNSSDITSADVIILSGVSTLQSSVYKSLLTSVAERGTGLMVFLPRQMDSSLYSNGIFRDIFPVEVKKRMSVNGEQGNIAVLDWFDISHPILDGVSNEGDFQKPKVKLYTSMLPTGRIAVLARFSDGSMAVGNVVCGRGRVLVFALDSSLGDSDLPLTGIFVPLFLRSVQYLSGYNIYGGWYETGDRINEFIGEYADDRPVTIKPWNSPARLVDYTLADEGIHVNEVIAEKPGFYSIYAGDDERSRFAVDTPRSEIRFTRVGSEQMAEAYKNIEWRALDESENVTDFVLKERYGTELFGLFIVLTGMLLVIEMVISRKV